MSRMSCSSRVSRVSRGIRSPSTANGVRNSLADLQEECPEEAYPEARNRSVTREEDVMDMLQVTRKCTDPRY